MIIITSTKLSLLCIYSVKIEKESTVLVEGIIYFMITKLFQIYKTEILRNNNVSTTPLMAIE